MTNVNLTVVLEVIGAKILQNEVILLLQWLSCCCWTMVN